MTEDEELLAAIKRTPEDDTPRLALAEVLTRRGDTRGEFIRLECENARRRAKRELDDVYVAEMLREWALYKEHRSTWIQAMGFVEEGYTFYRWDRGFITDVMTGPEAAVTMPEALNRYPIDLLQVSYPTRGDVGRLVESGIIGAAPRMMFDQISPIDDPLDAESIRALSAAAATRRVKDFAIGLRRFPGGADVVARAPFRKIRLSEDLDADALDAANGAWSSTLRELWLTIGELRRDAYERLLHDPSLAGLEGLTLVSYGDNGGDTILREVAAAPLRNLAQLGLYVVSLVDVAPLVHTPNLAGLRCLELRGTSLDGASMRALLANALLLEELVLDGVEIDQAAIDAIATRGPRTLRRLLVDTSSTGLDLRPIVASSRYSLRELVLRGDGVNDHVFAALGRSPQAMTLAKLAFAGPVTVKGIRAFVAGPDLPPGLGIRWRHWPEDEVTRALTKRFPLATYTM
jgi:uncharacterized protein (TIGR02996 family)